MQRELALDQITAARARMDGDYTSTSRIVDTLLDLRGLSGGGAALVSTIDGMIMGIPGRSVAANDWWLEQLGHLERLFVRSPDVPGTDDSRGEELASHPS